MIERLRSSQWSVGAALLFAAACGAEASSTAPDTSVPPTTEDTVVAVVPTTRATTTTTAPPPDPAECERAYSELVAEETERRRTLLNEHAEEQAQRVETRFARRAKSLDALADATVRMAVESANSTQERVDSILGPSGGLDWQLQRSLDEIAATSVLKKDDLAAERIAELTEPRMAASDQLTDWFIDFAGPEGVVRFEGQVRGCVCSQEPSVVADAQSERVRAFLADEASRQSALVRTLFDERRQSLRREVRSLESQGLLGGVPAIGVALRSDQIVSERSEALHQITNRENQRHRDFFFDFHSPEAQSLLEYACSLP